MNTVVLKVDMAFYLVRTCRTAKRWDILIKCSCHSTDILKTTGKEQRHPLTP